MNYQYGEKRRSTIDPLPENNSKFPVFFPVFNLLLKQNTRKEKS